MIIFTLQMGILHPMHVKTLHWLIFRNRFKNVFKLKLSLITSVNSLLSCLENWANYVLSEDERIIRASLGGGNLI